MAPPGYTKELIDELKDSDPELYMHVNRRNRVHYLPSWRHDQLVPINERHDPPRPDVAMPLGGVYAFQPQRDLQHRDRDYAMFRARREYRLLFEAMHNGGEEQLDLPYIYDNTLYDIIESRGTMEAYVARYLEVLNANTAIHDHYWQPQEAPEGAEVYNPLDDTVGQGDGPASLAVSSVDEEEAEEGEGDGDNNSEGSGGPGDGEDEEAQQQQQQLAEQQAAQQALDDAAAQELNQWLPEERPSLVDPTNHIHPNEDPQPEEEMDSDDEELAEADLHVARNPAADNRVLRDSPPRRVEIELIYDFFAALPVRVYGEEPDHDMIAPFEHPEPIPELDALLGGIGVGLGLWGGGGGEAAGDAAGNQGDAEGGVGDGGGFGDGGDANNDANNNLGNDPGIGNNNAVVVFDNVPNFGGNNNNNNDVPNFLGGNNGEPPHSDHIPGNNFGDGTNGANMGNGNAFLGNDANFGANGLFPAAGLPGFYPMGFPPAGLPPIGTVHNNQHVGVQANNFGAATVAGGSSAAGDDDPDNVDDSDNADDPDIGVHIWAPPGDGVLITGPNGVVVDLPETELLQAYSPPLHAQPGERNVSEMPVEATIGRLFPSAAGGVAIPPLPEDVFGAAAAGAAVTPGHVSEHGAGNASMSTHPSLQPSAGSQLTMTPAVQQMNNESLVVTPVPHHTTGTQGGLGIFHNTFTHLPTHPNAAPPLPPPLSTQALFSGAPAPLPLNSNANNTHDSNTGTWTPQPQPQDLFGHGPLPPTAHVFWSPATVQHVPVANMGPAPSPESEAGAAAAAAAVTAATEPATTVAQTGNPSSMQQEHDGTAPPEDTAAGSEGGHLPKGSHGAAAAAADQDEDDDEEGGEGGENDEGGEDDEEGEDAEDEEGEEVEEIGNGNDAETTHAITIYTRFTNIYGPRYLHAGRGAYLRHHAAIPVDLASYEAGESAWYIFPAANIAAAPAHMPALVGAHMAYPTLDDLLRAHSGMLSDRLLENIALLWKGGVPDVSEEDHWRIELVEE